MARPKRTSKVLEMSEARETGLRAINIDPDLDLGQSITLRKFQELIGNTKGKLDTYHLILEQGDQAQTDLEGSEEILNAAFTQVLVGIAAKFGKDSSEYERAGGIRTSDRKQPGKKAKPEKAKSDK